MARRWRECLIAAVAVCLVAGCATPRVQRFADPAHADARYDGFLAYAAFSDLGLEATYERALCRRLLAAGHACTTLLAAAPPTRQQDGASRHAASRRSGAQAVVLIELADRANAARQALAGGRAAYEVSVIDNARQTVVTKMAVAAPRGRREPEQRAAALAKAIVEALADESLLYERR